MKNTNESNIIQRNGNKQLRQTAVKCRFFAQYLGQIVFFGYSNVKMKLQGYHLDENFYNKTKVELSESTNPNPFLELKNLQNILDTELVEIIPFTNIQFSSRYSDEYVISEIRKALLAEKIPAILYDFLRSKGYALPFMEYSVDKLVSLGWVRLS